MTDLTQIGEELRRQERRESAPQLHLVSDYAHNERQAYLRESAHRHVRIVRLWRRLVAGAWRQLVAEGLVWIVVGLMLGDYLRRVYG